MKAIGITTYGGPEVLHEVELPDPHAGSGQVRIRVLAAGVNPADVMLRDGSLAELYVAEKPPFVPGMDVAGVLDEIGPNVDPDYGLEIGQEVVGIVDNHGPVGGYSQFVALPAESVTAKPVNTSFIEAASFLMNALTARTALDALDLKPESSLLVTGAAGAFGGHVVELACEAGIRVIAVASPADEELARSLGASDFIPRGDDLAARARRVSPDGVDAVADGAGLREHITPSIRDGGQLLIVRPWSGTPGRGISVTHIDVRSRVIDRDSITDLRHKVEAGVLTPRVARVFPAEDASRAHELLERGGVRGRIILDMGGDIQRR